MSSSVSPPFSPPLRGLAPAQTGGAPESAASRAIPVSELARRIRQTIEQAHPLQWIAGEISGFTRASSGHWYFSLKDPDAQIRCAMFRGRNQWVDWQPKNGDAVEVRGLPTLYEARGEFQIVVEQLRPAGQGALYEAFARLREKLEQEGLFDPARKRALPARPRTIGVVSSPAAAAWRDVLSTLARRAPHLAVILYPSPVQGADAPAGLVSALAAAARRDEVDVLIVCRGGGSIEDLWAFNHESVARAIAASPIPVISGVGHETDFTIADFVADLRAPTPTAAAELCAPASARLLDELAVLRSRMSRAGHLFHSVKARQLSRQVQRLRYAARRGVDNRSWALDRLALRLIHPGQQLRQRQSTLEHWQARLHSAFTQQCVKARQQQWQLDARLQRATRVELASATRALSGLGTGLARAWRSQQQREQHRLLRLRQALGLLDPGQVLARGYSLSYDSAGRLLRSSKQVHADEKIVVVLADGSLSAQVLPP